MIETQNNYISCNNSELHRSASEIAKDVKVLTDPIILNKIDTLLQYDKIIVPLNELLNNRQFPSKSNKSIIHFFETKPYPLSEKLKLIDSLKAGMIKELKAGIFKLTELIDIEYSHIIKLKIFEDFCETVNRLSDSKDSQGSTGTGAGEILLCILTKDGYLPLSKGDINIFDMGMEVKSSNGRIAAFSSILPSELDSTLKEYFSESDKIYSANIKDLDTLIQEIKHHHRAKEFLVNFFTNRSIDKSYNQAIKRTIENMIHIDRKTLQMELGKILTKEYQKAQDWRGIIIFKKSSNILAANISVAFSEDDFEKYLNYNGLGLTNGNQPVYLIVTAK